MPLAESKGPAAFTVEVTDEEEVTAASFMKALKARDPPLPAVAVSIVLALTLKQQINQNNYHTLLGYENGLCTFLFITINASCLLILMAEGITFCHSM